MNANFHSKDLNRDFEVLFIMPSQDQFTIKVDGHLTTLDGIHRLEIDMETGEADTEDSFRISQAQAAEWHTSLVKEEEENKRLRSSADALAKCLHYFMDNNAKRHCQCDRCQEARTALAAHERTER